MHVHSKPLAATAEQGDEQGDADEQVGKEGGSLSGGPGAPVAGRGHCPRAWNKSAQKCRSLAWEKVLPEVSVQSVGCGAGLHSVRGLLLLTVSDFGNPKHRPATLAWC